MFILTNLTIKVFQFFVSVKLTILDECISLITL